MKIAVLGSFNMTLVAEVERLPQPGETVLGRRFSRVPGGRGLIQAVAAARLGAEVSLFGKVGNDELGRELLRVARENGVDASLVEEAPTHTGTFVLLVGPDKEALSAYTPGANAFVDEAYITKILPHLSVADALLLQLEIPLSSLAFALRRLPKERPLVVLNPAPPQDIMSLPLARVNVLVPNVQELKTLADWSGSIEELERVGKEFLDRGVKALVVTAGEDGAYLVEPEGMTHFPAVPVAAVDPAGAGEVFCAGLAVKLAQERGLYEAIGFAAAAAALSTQKPGVLPSLPTLAEVQALLTRLSD
ncbi:MAG: ribokinase [Candidatus Bipolaricaulaceae bacterium]